MENKRPDFISQDGNQLTPDGEKLRQFIEGQFMNADGSENDAVILNGMSGHIGHYYVNVHKLGMMTPQRWMKDFKESFAANAYRDMQWFAVQEAQAQQVQETAEQTNDIAAQLEKLQQQLVEVVERNQELEARLEAVEEPPKPKRKPRKAKVTEAEEPVDDEPETDEPVDEPETEDSEAEDASEEA